MKNRGYSWVSPRKQRQFLERTQNKKKENHYEPFYMQPLPLNPKVGAIAVMLDIDGTTDNIDDTKATLLMQYFDWLRIKFEAEVCFISVSTHYDDTYRIKRLLEVLSHNLTTNIVLDVNFFMSGTYDYETDSTWTITPYYNLDKIRTFLTYYKNKGDYQMNWFGFFDDNLDEFADEQFQNSMPALIGRPTARKGDDRNMMNISTTTRGIEGVLEILANYIDRIKDMTKAEVLECQRNIIYHLPSNILEKKIARRQFAFLEKYFKEGYADDADYEDTVYSLAVMIHIGHLTLEELRHIENTLDFIIEYLKSKNRSNTLEKALKLKQTLV